MPVWKIIFLSKWVMCSFQPLIFQGCSQKTGGKSSHLKITDPPSLWLRLNVDPLSCIVKEPTRGLLCGTNTKKMHVWFFFEANPSKTTPYIFANLHCLESPPKMGGWHSMIPGPKKKLLVRKREVPGINDRKTPSSCKKFNGCSIFPNVEVLLFGQNDPARKGAMHESSNGDQQKSLKSLGFLLKPSGGIMRMQKWWKDQQKHMKFVRITLYKLT